MESRLVHHSSVKQSQVQCFLLEPNRSTSTVIICYKSVLIRIALEKHNLLLKIDSPFQFPIRNSIWNGAAPKQISSSQPPVRFSFVQQHLFIKDK
ncbi:hypothetical protein BpHYR1_014098 [Brachionus plicatilis]|uniref:Uncharacterized protein n=1 Tax=Brachionus plicatilis TaxID=10195 RepID=A0A3M7PHJ8_BRAPC|nr:hypothetical protein BpHYR1_014098 [Brachionus plicatilis]